MDKKAEFGEALAALVEYATVQGNELTKDDITSYLSNIIEDDTMYEAVYQYLSDNKIKVKGFTPSCVQSTKKEEDAQINPATETEEESLFLNMYMDDLKDVDVLSLEEKMSIMEQVIEGDKSAINKLTEAYLPSVIKIADEFKDSGMKHSDLISEGNLELFESIISLKNKPSDLDLFFEDSIRNAMKNAINTEIGMLRTSSYAMNQANAVSEATTLLADKLGREATLPELSEYLSMPEENIREIIKMSLDAVNIIPE